MMRYEIREYERVWFLLLPGGPDDWRLVSTKKTRSWLRVRVTAFLARVFAMSASPTVFMERAVKVRVL